jgi:Gpi18-like mannosyltransferase
MKRKDLTFIFIAFFVWRVITIVFAVLSPYFLTLQKDFLGGGFSNYIKAPWFWGWLNFDGEHYLSITQVGYLPLTYFYFPLYPLLVRIFSLPFHSSFHANVIVGLLLSNLLLIISLVGLWRLLSLDYPKKITQYTIALILLFPTSFYLGGYYTEALFLALAVWAFYFIRQKKWIVAGLLIGASTATRIIGLALIPALIFELYLSYKSRFPAKTLVAIILSFSGIALYMLYLNSTAGDPLAFFHNLSIFGAQRQSSLVLFPQVFYRYLFKVLPAINYNYFPVVFSTYLEFIAASIFLVLAIVAFLKLRTSYTLYLFFAYLISTLPGSFSSFSRYALVLFPGFILMSIYLIKAPRLLKAVIFSGLFVALGIATMLFVRGYWIA